MRKSSTLPPSGGSSKYLELHAQLGDLLPQLYARLQDLEEFAGFRLYVRADASVMGVVKGYDSNGGPVVCFGTSFDVVGCLLAVEGSLAAGSWRPDVPWEDRVKIK